jgi:hypothetical protein
LGLQWQWQANPAGNWLFPTSMGFLRMFSVRRNDSTTNLWNAPHLLLQKFPAENFSFTIKMQQHLQFENERSGLIVFGMDYAILGIQKTSAGVYFIFTECIKADKGSKEKITVLNKLEGELLYLKCTVNTGAVCNFAYSTDGRNFILLPQSFIAKPGRWVGAKIGVFCSRINNTNDAGFVDLDDCQVDFY